MPVLHNRISNEELKARMLAETEPRTTVSFYKYFTIDDPKAFRDSLYVEFDKLKVFGRIYVAKEGINAQIGVSLGVATYPNDATTKEALIRVSDERMYGNKEVRKSGR